MMDSVHSDSDL